MNSSLWDKQFQMELIICELWKKIKDQEKREEINEI